MFIFYIIFTLWCVDKFPSIFLFTLSVPFIIFTIFIIQWVKTILDSFITTIALIVDFNIQIIYFGFSFTAI